MTVEATACFTIAKSRIEKKKSRAQIKQNFPKQTEIDDVTI